MLLGNWPTMMMVMVMTSSSPSALHYSFCIPPHPNTWYHYGEDEANSNRRRIAPIVVSDGVEALRRLAPGDTMTMGNICFGHAHHANVAKLAAKIGAGGKLKATHIALYCRTPCSENQGWIRAKETRVG